MTSTPFDDLGGGSNLTPKELRAARDRRARSESDRRVRALIKATRDSLRRVAVVGP